MHAYIVIHARPLVSGEKIKEFTHVPSYEEGCYVYQNRALTIEEHNTVVRKVVEMYARFRPYSRIISGPPEVPASLPADTQRIEEMTALIVLRDEEIARLRAALPTGKKK